MHKFHLSNACFSHFLLNLEIHSISAKMYFSVNSHIADRTSKEFPLKIQIPHWLLCEFTSSEPVITEDFMDEPVPKKFGVYFVLSRAKLQSRSRVMKIKGIFSNILAKFERWNSFKKFFLDCFLLECLQIVNRRNWIVLDNVRGYFNFMQN